MPGVPSYRGCEACRRQKKKCDQIKPSCSRCTRLRTKCIGSGLQRYKFIEQNNGVSKANGPVAQGSVPDRGISLPPNPSSEMTLLTSDFISLLEVKDLRYDIIYYGDFLRDIPGRLGTSDALDASVRAVASAFPSLHTNQISSDMLRKYVRALSTLRASFDNPATAYSSNTLCAIYLVEVCQSWIGRYNDEFVSHQEVVAHFLNCISVKDWTSSFDIGLIITLCIPVLMESFANRKICLKPFFSNMSETYGQLHGPSRPPEGSDSYPSEGITFRSIAKIKDYFHDPERYLLEIKAMYRQLQINCDKARRPLTQWSDSGHLFPDPSNTLPTLKQHIQHQAVYGLCCTLNLILGSILRVFDPNDNVLTENVLRLSDEVVWLAEDASQYRPVGSGYIPLCLIAAWAAMDGTLKQREIASMLQQWQTDFESARWIDMALWLKGNFDDLRLRLLASRDETLANAPNATMGAVNHGPRDVPGAAGACCIQ